MPSMQNPSQPPDAATWLEPATPGWVTTGSTLIACRTNESWKLIAPSFSAYIHAEAKKRGTHASALWRCLSALEFYQSLGGKYNELCLPPATTLPNNSSPEHFELIERISRYAPRDLTERLLKEAINGSLTRRELRDTWKIYEKALGSPSRRGRRPQGQIRSLTPAPAKQPQEWNAGQIMFNVARDGPSWMGLSEMPIHYRVFVFETLQLERINLELEFEMLFVVQPQKTKDILFHGLEFLHTTPSDELRWELLINNANYCAEFVDYYWVVLPWLSDLKLEVAQWLDVLPKEFGVLDLIGETISMIRMPDKQTNPQSTQLAAYLLLKTGAGRFDTDSSAI